MPNPFWWTTLEGLKAGPIEEASSQDRLREAMLLPGFSLRKFAKQESERPENLQEAEDRASQRARAAARMQDEIEAAKQRLEAQRRWPKYW